MGLTVSKTAVTPFTRGGGLGDLKVSVVEATFDSAYLTGGESLTPADLGLTKVDFAICNVVAVGGSVNVAGAFYDKTNKTLELYDETPAEPSGDVSNIVVQVVAFGK